MKGSVYIIGIVCGLSLAWGQEATDSVTIGSKSATMRAGLNYPVEIVYMVPAFKTAPVLDVTDWLGVRWYQVEYGGKKGWIDETYMVQKRKSEVGSSSTICEMEGVKGLKFGMTLGEVLELNLKWSDTTLHDLASDPNLWQEFQEMMGNRDLNCHLATLHETTFTKKKALGMLDFFKGRLMALNYVFGLDTQEPNEYISAYFEMKDLLALKYGEPTIRESLTGIYKDQYPKGEYAGLAIITGKGLYKSQWSCPQSNTFILLSLFGKDRAITLLLRYYDQDFDQSEEEKQEALLDEF